MSDIEISTKFRARCENSVLKFEISVVSQRFWYVNITEIFRHFHVHFLTFWYLVIFSTLSLLEHKNLEF